MTSASVLVALRGTTPARAFRPLVARAARAAGAADGDELVVVVDAEELSDAVADTATVLLDEADEPSPAGALRIAADWCARQGHDDLVVGFLTSGREAPVTSSSSWQALASASGAPIILAELAQRFAGLLRIDVMAWPLLPLEGSVEAALRSQGGLVEVLDLGELPRRAPATHARDSTPDPGAGADPASPEDVAAVAELLGRAPMGPFRVVVRSASGAPVVIENAPFLDDGTPMPTTYWLVGRNEREAVGRLEAAGGVRRAEAVVASDEIAAAHARYAAARDARIGADHRGPRPSGGVGGTRTGVKCLHAHLAWYLAGGRDPVGRFVARELAGDIEGPVAAIDCGTNSTRLLVADRRGATIARETRITRLGEGVEETGVLSPAAIERTVSTLGEYEALVAANGVVGLRCVATSAARDAANAEELFAGIATVLGAPPELLSGEQEGTLAYRGATAGLAPGGGPFVVVDLGGGSTELVTEGPEGIELVSLAMGCVRIRERFLCSDPPLETELDAARAYVRPLLEQALAEHPCFGAGETMVGVAGTVSTLALLASGATRYVFGAAHHVVLERGAVRELLGSLARQRAAERAERDGIEPGRADVIVAGAVVLDEVMDVLGVDELVCSESDILDGLVAAQLS